MYRILSGASRFGGRFWSNDRRYSSKESLLILDLKFNNFLSLFFFLLLIVLLLKFNNPVYSGNLVLDLFDLLLLKYKFLFNFSGVSS